MGYWPHASPIVQPWNGYARPCIPNTTFLLYLESSFKTQQHKLRAVVLLLDVLLNIPHGSRSRRLKVTEPAGWRKHLNLNLNLNIRNKIRTIYKKQKSDEAHTYNPAQKVRRNYTMIYSQNGTKKAHQSGKWGIIPRSSLWCHLGPTIIM